MPIVYNGTTLKGLKYNNTDLKDIIFNGVNVYKKRIVKINVSTNIYWNSYAEGSISVVGLKFRLGNTDYTIPSSSYTITSREEGRLGVKTTHSASIEVPIYGTETFKFTNIMNFDVDGDGTSPAEVITMGSIKYQLNGTLQNTYSRSNGYYISFPLSEDTTINVTTPDMDRDGNYRGYCSNYTDFIFNSNRALTVTQSRS